MRPKPRRRALIFESPINQSHTPMTTAMDEKPANAAKSSSAPGKTVVEKANANAEGKSGARVPKPDQQAHRSKVDALSQRIKDAQTKQSQVQEAFAALKNGGEGGPRRQELRQRLDALKQQQQAHRDARGKILDALKFAQESSKRRLDEIKQARDKLPYKSVQEIDRRIAELDQMVASATLKLVEEKRALSDITALRKHRKTLESFDPQDDAVQADRKKMDELRAQLDQFEPENKRLQKEFGVVLGELRAMDGSRDELNAKYKQLQTDRDEVKRELDALFDERRKLNEDFKRANNLWFESQREERARRAEQMKKEREEADRHRKLEQIRKAKEAAELPAFEAEINTCQVLMQLLQSYVGGGVVEAAAPVENDQDAKASVKPSQHQLRTVSADDNVVLPKGVKNAVALKKKSDRFDDEVLFGGSGSGKKKAGGQKPAQSANNGNGSASKDKESLKFGLDMMNQFVSLQVKIPAKVADVPATIQALLDKKKYYVENQGRVTKENIQKAKELEEKIMNELNNPKPKATAAEGAAAEEKETKTKAPKSKDGDAKKEADEADKADEPAPEADDDAEAGEN